MPDCQYKNIGKDGICFWWQRKPATTPKHFPGGCFSPQKMQYFAGLSKFYAEPYQNCPFAADFTGIFLYGCWR
jgi:hypothetical protein